MAAFRGRSLLRLGLAVPEGVDAFAVGGATIFVFCASDSGIPTLDAESEDTPTSFPLCSVNLGGRFSLISGLPPAIDVSGIPVFLGGCGSGCDGSVEGWYAVAV